MNQYSIGNASVTLNCNGEKICESKELSKENIDVLKVYYVIGNKDKTHLLGYTEETGHYCLCEDLSNENILLMGYDYCKNVLDTNTYTHFFLQNSLDSIHEVKLSWK